MEFLKSKRKLTIPLGIVLVIVLAFLLTRGRGQNQSTYQTQAIARGDLNAIVGATGSVRAAQNASLMWQTSGTVGKVNVKVGDHVNQNDVLAELDPSSLPQNIIQAQANLVSAQKTLQDLMSSNTAAAQAAIALQNAKDAYQKAYDYRLSLNGEQWIKNVIIKYVNGQQVPVIKWQKGLVDAQTIQDADNSLALAQAQLDDAQRNYDRLKNGPNPDDVAAAQANVDAAQATINLARIVAPFSGTVTQANPLPGDQVSAGTFAFRVDDLSALLVDVQVSEVDINNVAVGQPVTLTFDAIQGKTYDGVVTEVSQAGDVSSGAVNFTVTVKLTNADLLVKPGMTAAVNIIVNQVKDQILVPNQAVRLVNGKRVVYILENGAPKQVEVALGASSDTMSVVTGGNLKIGDLVILNPPTQFGPAGPVIRGGGG
ncbi:MAG: efflux RND transporter periplasmic adaptor subunit [Chloroflexi bacterium]|nr:efflux RND transporter periplasmic adaptor subunit [Chloroflexota bacterium]